MTSKNQDNPDLSCCSRCPPYPYTFLFAQEVRLSRKDSDFGHKPKCRSLCLSERFDGSRSKRKTGSTFGGLGGTHPPIAYSSTPPPPRALLSIDKNITRGFHGTAAVNVQFLLGNIPCCIFEV